MQCPHIKIGVDSCYVDKCGLNFLGAAIKLVDIMPIERMWYLFEYNKLISNEK